MPLVLKGNLPYVQATTAVADGPETDVHLVLDMGAAHTVSLNASRHDALSPRASAIETQIGRGLSGVLRGDVGRITSFTLGGHRLSDVVATFPGAEHENPRGIDSLDGNLGMGIMSRFNFTLDYAAKTLYLEPAEGFSDVFEWNMSGLTLEPADGDGEGLAVVEVVPGSPATAADLQPGDVILELNGRSISAADRQWVRDLLRHHGVSVSLRYRRGTATAETQLKLLRLI